MGLQLQEHQAWMQQTISHPFYGPSLGGTPAWTGLVSGRVVGCAGVLPAWPGRGTAWALLTHDIPRPAWAWLARAMRLRLDDLQDQPAFRRIDCQVASEFPAGHRLARALGFVPEGVMRSYGADGRDYCMYARVRHGS